MAQRQHKRLGELLLEKGLLSRASLMAALSNQMVYGGRLGTNLVELELIDIDDLSQALAVQWDVLPVGAELLSRIDEDTMALLTPQLAERYQAIPLVRHGGACVMVMAEPTRQKVVALEEVIGQPVRPRVVPELRVRYLLEHLYEIARPQRFLRVSDGLEQRTEERRRYFVASLDTNAM